MTGACECGNEPSGSIKCGEFLDWLRTGLLLRKDSAAWSYLVSQSVGRSVSRSVGRSVSRSVGRSVGQSFGRSVDQSVSQSVS